MKIQIQPLINKAISGFCWGVGFFFAFAFIGFSSVIVYPLIADSEVVQNIKAKTITRSAQDFIKTPPSEEIVFSETPPELIKLASYIHPATPVFVSTSADLIDAIQQANTSKTGADIVLRAGEYNIEKTLYIATDNIRLRSESGNPYDVVVKGKGMFSRMGNLIKVTADYFILQGITLEGASLHLVQVASEVGANYPIFHDSIFKDGREQFIKISYDKNRPNNYSLGGQVTNCLFYFSAGIAPHFYTGGIDGHGIRHWQINNNVFKDFASPGKHISEHAIHLWNNTAHNHIEGNVIVDSDRGIGLGMGLPTHPNIIYGNLAGVIKNNYIFHTENKDPYADTGIVLESSPNTEISGNYVYMEHKYPRAIEYRFKYTKDVTISGNHTNKRISSRDLGTAEENNNNESLALSDFVTSLNQHLVATGLNRYMD